MKSLTTIVFGSAAVLGVSAAIAASVVSCHGGGGGERGDYRPEVSPSLSASYFYPGDGVVFAGYFRNQDGSRHYVVFGYDRGGDQVPYFIELREVVKKGYFGPVLSREMLPNLHSQEELNAKSLKLASRR